MGAYTGTPDDYSEPLGKGAQLYADWDAAKKLLNTSRNAVIKAELDLDSKLILEQRAAHELLRFQWAEEKDSLIRAYKKTKFYVSAFRWFLAAMLNFGVWAGLITWAQMNTSAACRMNPGFVKSVAGWPMLFLMGLISFGVSVIIICRNKTPGDRILYEERVRAQKSFFVWSLFMLVALGLGSTGWSTISCPGGGGVASS